MELKNPSGKVIALVCEESGPAQLLIDVDVQPDNTYGEGLEIEDVEYIDYNPEVDVYYHVSDDGSRYYNSARILESAETLIPPSPEELRKTGMTYVTPLLGKVHGDDITYAINIVTNPVWLHKFYNEVNGDVEKAQALAIKRTFKGYI